MYIFELIASLHHIIPNVKVVSDYVSVSEVMFRSA